MPQRVIDIIKQQFDLEFPIVDSNDLLGGAYQVESTVDRDGIPLVRRKLGMLCYVNNETKYYILETSLDNTGWTAFNSGTSGSGETYVHPNDGGGSITTSLTGPSVISRVVVNAAGHVTATGVRSLTAADISASHTTHVHAAATTAVAGFMSSDDKTKLGTLSNYTHPVYTANNINTVSNSSEVIDSINIISDASGHITSVSATKKSLAIDWTAILNKPSFGSNVWLNPVADMTALAAIANPLQNSIVLVQDSGDGKPAQFVYNSGAWVKIADVDFQPYTAEQIKTLYESNTDTNALTDLEKDKLANLVVSSQGFIKTFNSYPVLVLKGSALDYIYFDWEIFGTFDSQQLKIIDGPDIISALDISARDYGLDLDTVNEIIKDTTFELSLTDSVHTEVKTVDIKFRNHIFYGTLESWYDNGYDFNNMTSVLQDLETFQFTVIAKDFEYIYFACPEYFNATFTTPTGIGGFEDPIISYYNNVQISEKYKVYSSVQSTLGKCTITVTLTPCEVVPEPSAEGPVYEWDSSVSGII